MISDDMWRGSPPQNASSSRLAPQMPCTQPVGVTMVSGRYNALVDEAVSHFQRHSGLDVIVLHNATDPSWAGKLNLDLMVGPRRVIYFDVDWWLLRPFDFEPVFQGKWAAVPDPMAHAPECFCYVDSMREGWNPSTYFNAGFFCCDLAQPEIIQLFQAARQKLADCHAGSSPIPVDSTDQYFLNWALQQKPEMFQPLGLEMNFFTYAARCGYCPAVPWPVVGLHAAGVEVANKLTALRAQAAVFEG